MNLIYISKFDPINELDIEILESYQGKYDNFVVVPLNLLTGSEIIEDYSKRIEMLQLIKDKYKLNIDIFADLSLDKDDISEVFDSLEKKYGESDFLLTGFNNILFKPYLNDLEFFQGIVRKSGDNFNAIAESDGYETELSEVSILKFGTISVPKEIYDYIIENKLYFVNKLFKMVDLERFKHSVSVANLCYQVAINNKIDKYKAFIAGLLHDCGKDLPSDMEIAIMHRYFIKDCLLPQYCYHQFTGSFLIQKEFDINDDEIINAIKYHCTGRKNMSDMEKIVYSCDKIDPYRGYDSEFMIKAVNKNITKGFILVLSENYKFLTSKSKNINNYYSEECFKFYLGDLSNE